MTSEQIAPPHIPIAALRKLARHFGTPVPGFKWVDQLSGDTPGRYNEIDGIRLLTSPVPAVPYRDTLTHEFAHHLTWSRTPPFQKEPRSHGREFFEALVQTVEFLYEDPSTYVWLYEIEQIVRWWNVRQSRKPAKSA